MAYNIQYLNSLYRELWWNSDVKFNLEIKPTNYWNKKKKEKEFDNYINMFITHINNFPKEIHARITWKEEFYNSIDKIIANENIFKLGILDKNMKDQFFKSTKEFITKCKTFDSSLKYKDIGQAMRNVWIINIFQKIIGEDIKLTSAVLGYSLLYPYTDNYLDDTSIPLSSKIDFNNRFTKRLKGESIHSVTAHEEMIYNLVTFIESVFNREEYPLVYESLLLIHNAQEKSLTQQEVSSTPYERDILGISIEKGGTSVLADGYLINGSLTKEEEIFAYGYGFFLQLCDDLQDIKIDLKNNHMTLMSQLAKKYPLDSITNKLINLTTSVIDNANCFKCNNSEELKKLIKTNCITMILFAIADNADYYTKDYIKNVEKYLPFTLTYSNTLEAKLAKKFKNLNPFYHNVSLEDVFLYLIED